MDSLLKRQRNLIAVDLCNYSAQMIRNFSEKSIIDLTSIRPKSNHNSGIVTRDVLESKRITMETSMATASQDISVLSTWLRSKQRLALGTRVNQWSP